MNNQPNQFNQLNISQEPQPNLKPHSLKKFTIPTWISLLIIAIAALLAIALILRATHWTIEPLVIEIPKKSLTGETANWQTYRNEEYGYEFKYPKNWRVENLGDNAYAGWSNLLEIGSSFDQYGFSEEGISFIVNGPTIKSEVSGMPYDYMATSSILIDKISGTRYEGFYEDKNSKSGHRFISPIFLYKNNYLYEFSYENEGKNPLPTYNIFNQMISTIKFIEPTDTSDWRVYRNKEYGFEVKYPNDWNIIKESQGMVGLSPKEKEDYYPIEGALKIDVLNNPKKFNSEKFYRFYGLEENDEATAKDVGKIVYPYYDMSSNIEKIKVDDIDSLRFSEFAGEGDSVVVSVPAPNFDFFVEITGALVFIPNDEQLYNKLVSTFKFIE